jgi:hypothetical protein
MVEKLEISRDITAPPDVVYAAVSDVTRMGEWSEECYGCEWHEGFDGPVIGATFDGHNRHGEQEWTTQGKVIDADPGRAFGLRVLDDGLSLLDLGVPHRAHRDGVPGDRVERRPAARVRRGVEQADLGCRRPDGAQPSDDERHARSPRCCPRELIHRVECLERELGTALEEAVKRDLELLGSRP